MATTGIYKTVKGRDILLDFYDGMIGKWAFPHECADIPTRFGETHIVTAGDPDAPALVLLHGSASNLLGWGGTIPLYARDFRVVAPDMPGEAGRSGPVRPSWDNDEYVLWLDDLLDALGIGKAALLGISLGGWAAAKYAAHRPERASRIVLLAPGGISPARPSAVLKTVLYSMQGSKGAEKMKRLVFGGGEILPEVGRFFDLLQEHFIPRFGSPPLLSDKELGGISCPVMMVSGGEDAFFDAKKSAGRLGKLLPNAEIHVDPNEQHGITDYGGRISEFLMGNPPLLA
jgi:pimeloyl-ACP methyl ester carboxylesterase